MSENLEFKDAVEIERIFDAPTEDVWTMWTEPGRFKRWYGPKGFSVPVAELDLRMGGKRLVCMEMQKPDGRMTMWTTGEYIEIIPNERLVYTESMADESGNVVVMGNNGYPTITQVTVLLEDLGGRTKMVLTHAGVPADSGGNEGWVQAFDKLEAHLETALKVNK